MARGAGVVEQLAAAKAQAATATSLQTVKVPNSAIIMLAAIGDLPGYVLDHERRSNEYGLHPNVLRRAVHSPKLHPSRL